MPDTLPLVLTISVAILTIMLVILAIKLIMVLGQVQESLKKFNLTIDKASQVVDLTHNKIEGILNPFHGLSVFVSNFISGLKITESFMAWLNRDQDEDLIDEDSIDDEDEVTKPKKK